MTSGYWCPHCKTMYGWPAHKDAFERSLHFAEINRCASGRCPGWRRILWRAVKHIFRRS